MIVASGVCAVHCRFCFRRHFPYIQALSGRAWSGVLQQIAADPTIEEVILSGGDPLTTPDSRLAEVAGQLAAIPHLRRLRVHSRLPIVLPQRVNDELLAWLRGTRLATFMVVHCNHPAELDAATAAALGRLVDAGVPVLNQAVLMRGINDDVDVLAEFAGGSSTFACFPTICTNSTASPGLRISKCPNHAAASWSASSRPLARLCRAALRPRRAGGRA